MTATLKSLNGRTDLNKLSWIPRSNVVSPGPQAAHKVGQADPFDWADAPR